MDTLTEIEREKLNQYYSNKHNDICNALIKTMADIVIQDPQDALIELAWVNDFLKGLILASIDRVDPQDSKVPHNIKGWPNN